MILLLGIAAVVATVLSIVACMEADNEAAVRKGYLRENTDPESYTGSDLQGGWP